MKKTLYLCMMGLCFVQSLFAQNHLLEKRITVSYREELLLKILEDIHIRFRIDFSYSNDQVPVNKKVTISAENKKLSEVLKNILRPIGLKYQVMGSKILIIPMGRNVSSIEKIPIENITISGFIKEKGSMELLPGASVYIPELNTGVSANNYGFYSITLKTGSYTLQYSMVGFEKKRIEFSTGYSQKMDVELEPVAALQEVVVSAGKSERISERTRMSSIDIPTGQIKDIPALLGEKDIFKVVQLFPGVQKGTEGSSGFYVRGGTPDQNLIILDDATVYNANHLFGFFSVFNGDAVKSVELIKGGFPARFGERLSSVMVVNMKDGSKETFKGEAGIGLLSSRFILEGPIQKNKSSFLVSGRRTYADLLVRPFMPKNQSSGFNFYDLTAKVHAELDSNNRFFISSYFGRDRLSVKEAYDGNKFSNTLGWGNATVTARWNRIINKKLFANTSLVFSNYKLNIDFKEKTPVSNYSAIYTSGITDLGGRIDVDYYPTPNHTIKMGVRSVWHKFTPSAVASKGTFEFQNSSSQEVYHSIENNIYVEDDVRVNDKISLNLGIRGSAFTIEGKSFLNYEPRISGNWNLIPNYSFKASYAAMTQYLHLLSNTGVGLPSDLWVPSTNKVRPQRSRQWAAGFAHDIPEKNLQISVESYYKRMNNILSYKEGASFLSVDNDMEGPERVAWESNITSGNGEGYGTEILIQRKKGKLSGWVSYTLSWAKVTFPEINQGKTFYPKQDRRHDFSLVGIYEFSEKVKLSFSWVYSSGAPVTIPRSSYSMLIPDVNGNQTVPASMRDYGEKGSFRSEAYHRLDLGAQFYKKKKRVERIIELGLYNAYNRFNPFYYTVGGLTSDGKNAGRLTKTTIFPIIPSATWTYKF